VLEHISARFFAFSAFFRAHFHHRVIRELRTFVAAAFAAIGTRCADEVAERALTGNDARSRAARSCTILAGLQRLEVVLFAIREKFGAMAATGIAAAGAIVARFRARHEALVVKRSS